MFARRGQIHIIHDDREVFASLQIEKQARQVWRGLCLGPGG
jgi:hypothetical protein